MSKKVEKNIEELIKEAIVPEEEQPYKIPDNWVYVWFTSILDIIGGTQPPKSEFISEPREGYIRLVQIRDFSTDEYITFIPFNKNLKTINKEDILIARYGASLGRILTGLSGAYNVALAKVVYPEEYIDRNFLYWLLRTEHFQVPLQKLSRSAQAGFNKNDLSYFALPLPPLKEQIRIAEKVDRLLDKINQAKQLIEEAKETFELRRAAILEKAFRGELTANWRKEYKGLLKIKDDLLKPVRETPYLLPNSWKWAYLDEVCEKITDGTHHSPKSYPEGEYKYITAKNIKFNELNLENITYVSIEDHREIYSRSDVKFGDVLYIKDGATTGIAAINNLDEEFSLLSSVGLLRANKEVLDPEYLMYCLNSPSMKSRMLGQMSGIAIRRLTLTKIKKGIIPIPPLEEQREIVNIITTLLTLEEKSLEAVNQDKLDILLQSTLSKAFRGELGTNDPTEESSVHLLQEHLV